MSDQPYTHKDAQSIADLSALLPFINKEYPFILRPGFDEGVLRRCEPQKIVIPECAETIQYQNVDGDIREYTVGAGPIPIGVNISATDKDRVAKKNIPVTSTDILYIRNSSFTKWRVLNQYPVFTNSVRTKL